MREVLKSDWLAVLQFGDIGIVRGKSLSMVLQNIQRNIDGADEKASHGLICKGGDVISEADGKMVTAKNKMSRYFSDHHKVWIYRLVGGMTNHQKELGVAYLSGVEEQARYGKLGIWEFTKEVFYKYLLRKSYTPKDRPGIFCTEHCARFANACHLPFIELPEEQVTPSLLLEWFIEKGVPLGTWELVAYYENGKFFLK